MYFGGTKRSSVGVLNESDPPGANAESSNGGIKRGILGGETASCQWLGKRF
jgi:hypothetical protein